MTTVDVAGPDLPLWQWTATQMAEAVASRSVSPLELVDAHLDRIAAVDGEIHAYCTLDSEAARRTARRLGDALARGTEPGPLAGVPVAVKDLLATRGLRTAFGSWHYRDLVPDEDDVAVARLRAAGAIVLGKTTTSEFGYAAVGDNPLSPATRNPWSSQLTSGGSSAGSGAAVAYGGAPLALGSDGGGSIRIPASLCGAVGFKPSMGRVPAWPGCKDERLPGISSWDALEHVGPLTRCVEDARRAMSVLAGPDPRDRFSIPGPIPTPDQGWLRGRRVGLAIDFGYVPVEPEVRATVKTVAALLADVFGCEVVAADPGFDDPFAGFGALIAAETDLVGLRELNERHPVSSYLRDVLEREWTAEDFTEGRRTRQQVCRMMAKYFADVDLMLTPTSPVPAFEPGGIGPTVIAGRQVHPAYWLSLCLPVNMTGQPAISLPAGRTASGLPIGVQLIGRHLGDGEVLAAAADLESALAAAGLWRPGAVFPTGFTEV
ncbi:amidase [Promicromonospora soli]